MKDFVGMLTKIMRIGQRKRAKPAVELPIPTSAGLDPPTVTVNHASRAFSIPSQPAALASVPPNPGVVEVLPLLKHVPLVERHTLFIRKLHLCSILFDFSNTVESACEKEKEIKGQTLMELIDLVRSGSYKMNEIMQEELVKMISVNIFRCLPPGVHMNTGKESGEGEDGSYMDPSWPHLQLVYELLLKYVESKETDSKIAKRYINHTFVSKLLDIFDSEDSREREYLKTILHRIYGKFMVHRPYIRNLINDVFYRFIFETERHNGIRELLDILGSIINGFALPMREEHKIFLVRALIPLHKPKNITVYHSQLCYCITQYVEKDYRLADTVIRGLLKYWPLTNCPKEVLFILELEEVLEVTQPMEFHYVMVPLFRQVGRCINSPHFQVAERALFLWNNDYILELIAQNRHVILPIIFDALENNSKGHWNQTILALTANVQRMFVELDPELVEDCERKYNVKLARVREMEERRVAMWKTLEEVAAKAGVEGKIAPKVRGKAKISHARKSTLLAFW